MSTSLMLLVLLGSVGPVIRANGTSGCPDAAAVSQRLTGLLGGGDQPGEPDQVELTQEETTLCLRLSRADGTLVAERRIPRSNRCAELADAAAALIAAWESDLHPEAAPPPPPAPDRTMVPVPVPVEELRAASPERDRAIYEVGVLPAVWLGGGRFSLAGAVRAGVWSRRAPVGMTVSVSATFPIDAGDSAWWRRQALSAGVMGRLRHRWLFVDGIAEVVVGWLVVSPERAEAQASFDPGLSVGVRAGSRVTRRLELFVSLAAWGAAWRKLDGVAAVPQWGLVSGLGGSLLFGL